MVSLWAHYWGLFGAIISVCINVHTLGFGHFWGVDKSLHFRSDLGEYYLT